MEKKIYIGTSGWAYSHWRKIFYPSNLPYGERLNFYSQHFLTTEVNSSFYHLPQEKTLTKWYISTPEGFIFSVKAPRHITHLKKLCDVEEVWNNFTKRIELLKDKLGPILLQFPPSFKKDRENMEKIINFLRGKESYKFALEFRDKSWFDEEVYNLMKELKAAWVIADSSRYPKSKVVTADFAYIRMHGPKALFSSCYSEKELEELAKDIEEYLKNCNEIYVYFNNDVNGCAIQNAKTLIKLTEHLLLKT